MGNTRGVGPAVVVSLSCPPEEMRQTIRNKLNKQNKQIKTESTAKDTLSFHEGKNNDYFTKKKIKGQRKGKPINNNSPFEAVASVCSTRSIDRFCLQY